MDKVKLFPNARLVFYFNEEGVVVCDPLKKTEFSLTEEYFNRLKFWDGNREDQITPLDEDLLEEELVLAQVSNPKEWGGDRLSLLAHLSTRNHPSITPEFSEEEVVEQFTAMSKVAHASDLSRCANANSLAEVTLPMPDLTSLGENSLLKSLKERKTSRNFDGREIKLAELSTLLHAAFGHIHGREWNELAEGGFNTVGERKSSPSSSGLQPCECYLAVTRVESLIPGFYRYKPDTHTLELLDEGCDDEMISHIMFDQFWIKGAACGLFITADMQRVWVKSDLARAYSYVYLDAGHLSQTTLLTATSLGLRTWLSGTMRDSFIAEKLQVDGQRKFPVLSVFIGHGTDDAVPAKIRERASGY